MPTNQLARRFESQTKIVGFIFAVLVLRYIATRRKYLWRLLKRILFGHEVFDVVPTFYPILCNVPTILKNEHRLFDWLAEGILPHGGKPVVFARPGDRFVMLTDPEHVKLFMETNFEFARRDGIHEIMSPMFGDGIFNSDGERWKRQRKIGSKLFTMRNLKFQMFERFRDCSNRMVRKLTEMSVGNPDNTENVVDIFDMFIRVTMDGFVSSAFGMDFRDTESAPETSKFSTAFDTGMSEVGQRYFKRPFWKLESFLGTPAEKRLAKSSKFCRDLMDDLVAEHRQRVEKGIVNEKCDLLTLFLNAEDKAPKRQIQDVCLNFIIAGRDTTSIMMGWCLYELGKNPECMEKVKEELRACEEITYENVTEMKYTEKCLLEALRLHPAVPHLARTCVREFELPNRKCPGQKWVVYPGDQILVSNYAMGRAPYVYDEPLKYDPDRFSQGLNTFPPEIYANFNLKPRLCLGRHVALMEGICCLWYFFNHFDYEPVSDQNVMYQVGPTLLMRPGYFIHLSARA